MGQAECGFTLLFRIQINILYVIGRQQTTFCLVFHNFFGKHIFGQCFQDIWFIMSSVVVEGTLLFYLVSSNCFLSDVTYLPYKGRLSSKVCPKFFVYSPT